MSVAGSPATLLTGRVAIVLGATGWIGTGISRYLLQAGANVVIVSRDRERLARLEQSLGDEHRVLATTADVTSQLDVDDVRAATLERFGHIDMVLVLAGVITGSVFEDGVPADWAEMIDVNLRGVLHSAQTFAMPLLDTAEQGRPADLVLLGAVTEESHEPRFAVFNAVSAAITQLGRTLRDEYGDRGLRVHVLAPEFPRVADSDPRRGREDAPVSPESLAAVVALAASLPLGVNLTEAVLRPTRGTHS